MTIVFTLLLLLLPCSELQTLDNAREIHDLLLLSLCGGGYIPAQRPHVFKFLLGPWAVEEGVHSCPLVLDCNKIGCPGNR